jgi:hypothetical protein
VLPKNDEIKVEELARLINATGGKEDIDLKLEEIIHLFSIGDIDSDVDSKCDFLKLCV